MRKDAMKRGRKLEERRESEKEKRREREREREKERERQRVRGGRQLLAGGRVESGHTLNPRERVRH